MNLEQYKAVRKHFYQAGWDKGFVAGQFWCAVVMLAIYGISWAVGYIR